MFTCLPGCEGEVEERSKSKYSPISVNDFISEEHRKSYNRTAGA